MKHKSLAFPAIVAVAWNMLLLLVCYGVTRLAFLLENLSFYTHLTSGQGIGPVMAGSLLFDISAITYTNALYAVLVLLPLHCKERRAWHRFCKWLFIVVNALALAVNLADAVYFQYTGRRTTSAIFSEFTGDEKLGSIVGIEFVNHWYLVVLFLLLTAFLWIAYARPATPDVPRRRYYVVNSLSLLVAAVLFWGGMRGSFRGERPIKLSTANLYIVRPNDASLVLNTPFSMIRTIGKASYPSPQWFETAALEREYTPVHQPQAMPADSTGRGRKNVVILFLESFGREYFGSLNRDLVPGYQGYTPFLDSLMAHAVTYRYTVCNGRASVDAMPSALAGLPMLVESFVAGSHSNNHLDGIASMLGSMGYETAFFHGAPATSIGLQAFAKSIGFQHGWSQEDYEADSRTGGPADSDNWWGIWDEPFLQYFRMKLSDMHEPFLGTLFTLSSHHPFQIPTAYKEQFPEGQLPIYKCIRYTDHALRRFFEEARKEPWFQNTLFVMTGDHPNMSALPAYRGGVNQVSTSIIFYDPSGGLEPGMRPGIAQQTDILPTVLGYVGYDKPYMAFGLDLFHTPPADTWAVNYLDGIYQYVYDDYLLQFNGERTIGLYRLSDYELKDNLAGKVPGQQQMERHLQAIIQQYMERMAQNRLRP